MESPFMKFCHLIRSLNAQSDSIVLDHKLKYLAHDISDVLEGDENMLWDALQFFNEQSLEDGDFGSKFALLFTSKYFDELKEHLMSSDGNCIFRNQIINMLQKNYSNAEMLKGRNMDHYYNSVNLLGEFYHRLRQKSHPIHVIGKSLFEVLTRQLRKEISSCLSDKHHEFDVRFARVLLGQITLNGALAHPNHQTEVESLLYEIRRCLVEIENMSSTTKAFLLMTLDMHYNSFRDLGDALNEFYGEILDKHDRFERSKRPPSVGAPTIDELNAADNRNSNFNLHDLRKDCEDLKVGLRTNGNSRSVPTKTDNNIRINREYLNRPRKASDRLKYFQQLDFVADDTPRRPHSAIEDLPKSTSSESSVSHSEMTKSISQNEKSPLLPSENRPDSQQSDSVTSPQSTSSEPKLPKIENNFNWYEAVEDMTSNSSLNDSTSKFETASVTSYTSERQIGSRQRNRSRRNSLNRFRSDYYRQSSEDINNDDFDRRSNRSIGGNGNHSVVVGNGGNAGNGSGGSGNNFSKLTAEHL